MFQLVAYSALAAFGGYIAVILTYLLLTFGLTSLSPQFVMQGKGQFTSGYIFIHPLMWCGCGLIGGYVAATIGNASPYVALAILAIFVVLVILKNSGEANRRAFRSKSALLFFAVLGVAGGGFIVIRSLAKN